MARGQASGGRKGGAQLPRTQRGGGTGEPGRQAGLVTSRISDTHHGCQLSVCPASSDTTGSTAWTGPRADTMVRMQPWPRGAPNEVPTAALSSHLTWPISLPPIPHPPSLVSHLPSLIDQLARLVLCGPVAVDCLPACRAQSTATMVVSTRVRGTSMYSGQPRPLRALNPRGDCDIPRRALGACRALPCNTWPAATRERSLGPCTMSCVPMVWLFGAASLSIERERWDAQAVEAAAAAAAAPSMAPLLGKPGVPALDD